MSSEVPAAKPKRMSLAELDDMIAADPDFDMGSFLTSLTASAKLALHKGDETSAYYFRKAFFLLQERGRV